MSDKEGKRCSICNARLRNYWEKEDTPSRNMFCPTCGHTALGAAQPQCGHPAACIVSTDEGTHYCAWCVSLDQARAEERERCARVLDTTSLGLMPREIIELHKDAGRIVRAFLNQGAAFIRALHDKEEPK